jgi:hypothetical protein
MSANIVDLAIYRERRDEDWDLVIAVDESIDPLIPQQFTVAEVRDMLEPAEFALVESWLSRGDSVAVFQNHDRSHHDLGRLKFESFSGEVPTHPHIEDSDPSSYRLVGGCQPVTAPHD